MDVKGKFDLENWRIENGDLFDAEALSEQVARLVMEVAEGEIARTMQRRVGEALTAEMEQSDFARFGIGPWGITFELQVTPMRGQPTWTCSIREMIEVEARMTGLTHEAPPPEAIEWAESTAAMLEMEAARLREMIAVRSGPEHEQNGKVGNPRAER